jgi:hypothetical protein
MRQVGLKGDLDWKTRHRIKAWSARLLSVVTFLILGSTTAGLGMLVFPLSFLPGVALYLLLWPDVLTPKPLPEPVQKRVYLLQLLVFLGIVVICIALRVFAGW